MISDFWINNKVQVYRKNNLVYVATLKCAHSFYCGVAKYNSWELIEFNNIDWLSNHVFGFIMDPVERYFKGLAQDIVTNDQLNCLKLLTENHTSKNFTILTLHSNPISIQYKDYLYKIDWIPLDKSPSSEFFLTKLCSKYRIDIEIPESIERHISSQEKKERYQIIKNMFGNFNETFYRIFSNDIDFYHTVNSNFNPYGQSWDEISWLKNYDPR
jgi:hypothetical protein